MALTVLLERSDDNYMISTKLWLRCVQNDINNDVRETCVQEEINS